MVNKISKVCACVCAISMLGTATISNLNVSAESTTYTTEFSVDLSGDRKEISPYIYGVNESADLDSVTTTAVRQGGNRYTGYNWETNYSNAGEDWKNSSDTYLSSSTTSGACAIRLSEDCQEHSIGYKFTTLQMAGYVSADSNGSVSADETAPSSRWNKVENHKDGVLSLTPDLTDGVVYMDEYVNYLVQTLGDSTTSTGIQGYSLDNEPALWNNTHPYLHSDPVSMKELVDKSTDLATVVKSIDPNADVFGGVLWGYLSYKRFDSLDTNDSEWDTLKAQNGYNWFIDYYLDQMHLASEEYGSRLLDYLDIHYYAQATSTTEDILQGVRTLYDEDYVENSWIGDMVQWYPDDLPILPNVQNAIDTYYPDTKLAISEYNFYGGNEIAGAIVEAEALGCFANEGVSLATYWDCESGSPYAYSAINLFTNYDGNGSSFGDTLLETTIEDNSKSNAYASISGNDVFQVDVVVTNKDMQNDEVATISLENSTTEYKSAVVYGIVDGSSDIVVLDKINSIENNSFKVELPSLSVVHVVVSDSANAFDSVEVSTPNSTPEESYNVVTYNAQDYLDSDGNVVLNLDNPESIAKIVIETDVTSSQGSQWWYGGGGIGVTLDSGWAYKGFSFSKSTSDLEVDFDGTFTDANKEEVTSGFASNKFEIQRWWTVSEKDEDNGSDVEFNYKTIRVYYQNVSGDGDEDSTVNYLNLLLAKKYLLGVNTLTSAELVDVNGDGSVDILDILAIKSDIIKSSTL